MNDSKIGLSGDFTSPYVEASARPVQTGEKEKTMIQQPIQSILFKPESIAPTLRQLRKAAGKTLTVVAEDVGISVSYLSDLERGRHDTTLTGKVKDLFEYYGFETKVKLVRKRR